MRQARAGKSLIETLVMISMLSLVLALSATSLATLFRLRHMITRDSESAASIERLALRLRLDAHEAVSADASDGCVFTLADGRSVRYRFTAPRMTREVDRDGTVIHRDSFLLPRHSIATFQTEPLGGGTLIQLVIKPAETRLPPRELPRTATIEAVVGLHRALARAGGER